MCFLVYSLTAVAQKQVSGRVTDLSGEPIVGAGIFEKGTNNGVITDTDGKFNFKVQNNSSVLKISFIGYIMQEIVVGEQTTLDVTLKDDVFALDEIAIVGYGVQKKVNMSGAVATISSKALESRSVSNANIALQGLSPNLNITRRSGMASMPPDINIRGYTSINGGSAFILVDNVPMSSGEFACINPADIESVSVLKDASSAAIYGGRAAFGVVLVTTKTAKSEKVQIDADYTYGIRQFDNLPEMMTDIPTFMRLQMIAAEEPTRFSEEAVEYARRRMSDRSLPEILGPETGHPGVNQVLINEGRWEYYGIYDWFDVMLKDFSPSQTANVRVSQKTDKLSYVVSGGLYREDGMLNYGNDVLQRLNFRGNATYNLTDRWKLGTNTAFNRQSYETNLSTGENEFWFYRLHSNYPTQPIYNIDGTYTQDGGVNVGSALSGSKATTVRNEIQLSFNTKFDIIKDVWSVNGDATFRMVHEDKYSLNIPTTFNNRPGKTSKPGDNSVREDRNHNNLTVYNLYTNFDKMFADKHFVSAMLGYNQEYFIYNNLWVSQSKLITESLPTIQLAQGGNLSRGQGIEDYALRGTFGRLNYIYDNKYIFEVNGRYDGSSRFPKKQRFGFFPSFSGAWVLSREGFMESINNLLKIDNLKLRGSYGTLGNQAVGYYPYIAGMGLINQIGSIIDGTSPQGMGAPGSAPDALTWETVRTIDGGIDMNLFNNRLDVSAGIYTRYTENMLTKSKALPSVFGTGEPNTNAADLKTKGWELIVGWRDAVDVAGSPLSYNIRLMISDSKAWITRFDNPDKNLNDYYEGQLLGDIWGYTTLGYFDSDNEAKAWADQSAIAERAFRAGDLKFLDINNDNKINTGSNTVSDPGDRKIIGNKRERFPYSVDAGVNWKGFDLRVFLQGIGARQAYAASSSEGLYFFGLYTTPWANANTKNTDAWTVENPSQDAFYPRMKPNVGNGGELGKPQTRYLQDCSYLRLKNLTFGYTFPSQWMQKAKIRNLRIYFSGENLYTFHHIQVKGNDPEKFGDNIYYPFQRTFSFGLNVGF
jgi:TonB-linked SusC/RagA family outer membrane protein